MPTAVAYVSPGVAGRGTSLRGVGLTAQASWSRGFAGHVERRGTSIALHAVYGTPFYLPPLAEPRTATTTNELDRLLDATERSLRAADGFVFVVDSQAGRFEANCEILKRLDDDLRHLRRRPSELPLVFQLNKRDLPHLLSVAELRSALRWPDAEYVKSVAIRGEGVEEAFASILDAIATRRRIAPER